MYFIQDYLKSNPREYEEYDFQKNLYYNIYTIILNTYGCTDSSAFNYSAGANLDDGSCLYCNDLNPSPVDNIITANTAPTSGMNDGTIFVQLSSTVPANITIKGIMKKTMKTSP